MIEPLSRRTLLRGAGVALALPLFGAMSRARNSAPAPRRVIFTYVPNGVHMPDWRPKAEGEALELGPTLEPLARWRDSLLLFSGLTQDKARAHGDGPGDHARSAASFLTGMHPLKTDGPIRAGVSADQLAARDIGGVTRLRSLELGCEDGRLGGQCDSDYSCAYSNSISWSSPHTPLGKETDPRLVFDRLFRDEEQDLSEAERAERRRRRKSVLDFVRDDAKRLSSKLGVEDRRKLDEYESGVRELERRIEFAEKKTRDAGLVRPAELPEDYVERAHLQCDLLALALETDSTRVATLMFANEGSGRSYPALGAPEGHHELSHHGGDPEKLKKIASINRHHIELLAHLLEALSRKEGDATLLDSTMIAYGSGISDGDRHNHDDLPVLLAGGRLCELRGGRHLRFPNETPCTNLWLSLLDRLGLAVPALGDSTGRLEGLA
ncbi:MAG: DUF1552 domain-containing protein [Planctomycetota bacterium]|nr:DUF1552 domain-containing protein [Planctomycetota bacterium]